MSVSINLFAWGSNAHIFITQMAVDLLPQWQKRIIAEREEDFVNHYCLLPDMARGFLKNGKNLDASQIELATAMIDTAVKIGMDCHRLWPEGTEKYKEHIVQETIAAYLPVIINSFRDNDIELALQYLGVLTHFIEDVSCPAHAGATLKFPPWCKCYFSYVKSVKPSFRYEEPYSQYNAHAAIDNCPFTMAQLQEATGNYSPRLLGKTIEDISYCVEAEVLGIDKQSAEYLVAMLECVTSGDTKSRRFTESGAASAANAARLTGDFLYSTLCMAYNKFPYDETHKKEKIK